MSFVNKRYTKGVPFLLKMVCKRITGGGKVGGPFSGAPNDNFRKISVRKTIWDLEFSEHLL